MNDYKDSQESRVERLNSMIRENRITRHNWLTVDEQGRETACLLAALSPEAGEAESPTACPASVMPEWFAHITPWIDDNGSDAEWPRVVRRYAACAARWSALDEAAWRRVEIAARRVAVVEAMSHTSDEQVLDACRQVLVWIDADMSEASRASAKAASEATAAAAWALAAASTDAAAVASAARRAAAAVAAAEAAAVASAARNAAKAAAWAVEAEAESAAEVSAADRITDKILSALEQECGL